MPKIEYVQKNFNASTLAVIDQANAIISEYIRKGFILTLRQLYYQFVSRDLLENSVRAYKRLGKIINDARLAGLIDWLAIEDRTRNVRANYHYRNPAEIIRDCADDYEIDKWSDQEFRPEVWIEKDALTGIISDVCHKHDISFFSCRGYVSQSEMWAASERLIHYHNLGQSPVILHFGDHDPSGIDMTRDILERLEMFTESGVLIERLALNMDQVHEYKPPPNPAKMTDSRFASYIKVHGRQSWELDALEPEVLTSLIEDTVLKYRDDDLWNRAVAIEAEHKSKLREAADNWLTA